jgi:predicted nucleotide-binding protein (sugar kinase/HSP70/actin superfamily)
MKASFPNLGYDTYALKTFLEDLGAEVILAPPNSRRTIELGALHSPELICMPYKITLGNMLEALDLGADTLFMAAGARKCRFGYYHYLHERALKNLGKECRFIPVTQYSPLDFVFKVMPGIFGVPPWRVVRAIAKMLAKSRLTQEFRQQLNRKMAIDFSGAEQAKPKALSVIERAHTLREIQAARGEVRRAFNSNGAEPQIRLGLVGEIYFMIEQFASQEIEKELGRMGAEVVFEPVPAHSPPALFGPGFHALGASGAQLPAGVTGRGSDTYGRRGSLLSAAGTGRRRAHLPVHLHAGEHRARSAPEAI